MIIRIPVVVGCGLAALLWAPGAAPAQTSRFTAQFVSGKTLNGAEIFDWNDAPAEPRLDNQKLFFPGDRVLWIEDNSIAPSEMPAAFVEFFGGDRLPGRVLEYRTGQESPFRKTPPCVVVEAAAAVNWFDAKRLGGVPVVAKWLRRVVWQARDDDRYRPGTLFYLDGRHAEFRSLRWSKNSVRLLLEQEARDVSFDQIAELHLPRPVPWDAWFDQLAALLPEGAGLVMQVETADALRATASTSRFSAATRGEAGKPDHWYHGIQPAWSVEPLWLPHRAIRMRRFFSVNEVPLSAIEPVRAIQKSNLAGGWNWELDRNVHSWPMRCAEHAFAWGFGVHAYSELGFDLPAAARIFRSQYGLDRAAGNGGCVRAAVYAGPPTGQPLHRSDHVIGSAKSHDTGPLSVAGAKQLTLVVDPAQNDRPAGADPFEIRDTFDWLQPIVELDPEALKSELERRWEAPLWGLSGWTVVNAKQRPCVVSTAWDQHRPAMRRCRVEVAPRDTFFSMTRRLEIGPRDQYLVVSVSRLLKDMGPSRIQAKVNGRAVGEFDVPNHVLPADPDPLLFPVDWYRGQEVDVELTQIALTPQSRVEWRGIDLIDRDPLVFEAFEDDPAFVAELSDGTGTANLESSDKFTGSASIRVTPADKNDASLPGWNVPIRSDPYPGEYRFVRFAWRKRGGAEIGFHLAQNGAFPPAALINPKETLRYHVGRGIKHDYGKSFEFRNTIPDQWELVTRDLFADFGAFDATGLRLVAGDGEWAEFDHVYFARRWEDLDRVTRLRQQPQVDPFSLVPADIKDTVAKVATDPLRYGEAISAVTPEFSATTSDKGVWLLKTHRGRTNVIRTDPPEQGKPCILRGVARIPEGKTTELKLSVSHHVFGDWQLLVFANGEKLHDSLISKDTTQEGWADLTIDLSRFAGRNIWLELHDHPNNWAFEWAYWNRIEIISK